MKSPDSERSTVLAKRPLESASYSISYVLCPAVSRDKLIASPQCGEVSRSSPHQIGVGQPPTRRASWTTFVEFEAPAGSSSAQGDAR